LGIFNQSLGHSIFQSLFWALPAAGLSAHTAQALAAGACPEPVEGQVSAAIPNATI